MTEATRKVMSVFISMAIVLGACSKTPGPGGSDLHPSTISQRSHGNEIGNGGNVLICHDSVHETYSYEALDLYEGRALRSLVPDLPPDLSAVNIVLATLKRLERLDRERAEYLESWVSDFRHEARFLEATSLSPVNDYGYIPIPDSCEIKQLILQKQVKFPEDGRYLIDKRIWDKLDEPTRAGMILHEVVYRDAIRRGQTDSVNTRYFTALVSSSAFSSLSQAGYDGDLTQSLLDAWLYYYPDRKLAFRLYDRRPSDDATARAFCERLGVSAHLAWQPNVDEAWTKGTMSTSAIARRAADPSGGAFIEAWTSSAPDVIAHFAHDLTMKDFHSPLDTKAAPLCTLIGPEGERNYVLAVSDFRGTQWSSLFWSN